VKLSHAPQSAESGEASTAAETPQSTLPPNASNPQPAIPASQITPPATAPPPTAPVTGQPPAVPPASIPVMPGGPAQQSQPPQGTARVYFTPSQVDTKVGQSISVTVAIDRASDLAAAPMIVQFDPKVLKLNDVTEGSALSAGGQQTVFTKNIQNDAGKASIQLSLPPGKPGVDTTAGTLVTLNFQAVETGISSVTIPFLTVRNSRGQVIASNSPQLTVSVK